MARKRNVPVVGSKQLHPVQVSQQVRQLEAHRTKEAARREAAPTLAADRGAFATTKKQYRGEAQSARGEVNAVEGSLAQALAGLKSSGLTGRYLQETKNEFTSRAGDAASSLPFLLSGAREERGKALTEDRSQLLQDRAAMQKTAASSFDQRLKELRGAGSTAVKEQGSNRQGHTEETNAANQEVSLAVREAKRLMAAYPEELPSSNSEWEAFVGTVAKADGVGLRAAMNGVRLVKQQLDEQMHRGVVPQPGVPKGPRQLGG